MPGTNAGDQLSNPLVDFVFGRVKNAECWGSTLKPPGRLPYAAANPKKELGINSQTPW